jgi:outer membrane protein OmpA-like peptidoglycan-associated protein
MKKGLFLFGILFFGLMTIPLSGHFAYQSDCEWLTTPATYGPNAVFYNPALLSYPKNPSFSLEFLRFGFDFTNNTFSVSNWNDFWDHDTLDTSYKSFFMDLIPSNGFEASLGLDVGMLGVKIGNFAFCPRVVAGANQLIPKDVIDLGLYGNQLGRTYHVTGTRAEAIAYNEYGLGYSRPFTIGEDKKLYAGISFSYIRGIFYGEVEKVDGDFTSDSFFVEADLDTFHYRYSFNQWGKNQGLSTNIGFAYELNKNMLIDLSFRNLLSTVGWVDSLKTGFVAAQLDPINVIRYISVYRNLPMPPDSEKWDDAFETFYQDTVDTSNTEFSMSLPILMGFGLSYEGSETYKLFMQYEQGFKKGALTTTTPKVTLSGEYNPWKVLPLRAGFSFGGHETFAIMTGIGLSFDQFYMDLGYGMHKGVFMSSKGQSLAFDVGIRSSLKAKIHGTIRDSVTLKPLVADMKYRVGDKQAKLVSREDGTYSISIPAGKVVMVAYKDEYYEKKVTKTVETGETARQDILLVPKFGYVACTVMDSVTSEPLAAKIVISGTEQSEEVTADEKGEARVKLLAGDYKFDVSYPEYAPQVRKVTVPRGMEVKKVFRLLKAGGVIKGLVYDAKTKEPVPSAIAVVDAATNKDVTIVNTDEKGAYKVALKKGTYMLKVTPGPKEYIYQEAKIPLASGETVNKDFALLKKKMKFVFHNILFDFDKATLRPESYAVLDSIGRIMVENPTIVAELSGHTDSRGSRSYNQRLSQRRANSARNYIVQQWKIPSNRIIAKGYGEDQPLVPGARTEAEHQQNRRVEFTVIREQ